MLKKTNSSYRLHNRLFEETASHGLSLLVSDNVRDILQWFLFTAACQPIAIFGVVSNIINIICFVKQGFKDPVNISLLGLAISDMGCLITAVWSSIFLTPAVINADLPFDPFEFQHLTSAWPHSAFCRVSSWITAFITLERCLCIAVPLRVKYVVTPRRVFIINTIVFVVLISPIAPIYVVNKLGRKFFPEKNKTLIGFLSTKDHYGIEIISIAVNNVFIPFCSFTAVIIGTIILVIKLYIHYKWGHTATKYDKSGVSNRNLKVAQMVVMISTLFIVCSLPLSVVFISVILEPRLSVEGQYRNMVIVLLGFCVILESINSSGNIFIYYHVSGRYRAVYRKIFCTRRIVKAN